MTEELLQTLVANLGIGGALVAVLWAVLRQLTARNKELVDQLVVVVRVNADALQDVHNALEEIRRYMVSVDRRLALIEERVARIEGRLEGRDDGETF